MALPWAVRFVGSVKSSRVGWRAQEGRKKHQGKLNCVQFRFHQGKCRGRSHWKRGGGPHSPALKSFFNSAPVFWGEGGGGPTATDDEVCCLCVIRAMQSAGENHGPKVLPRASMAKGLSCSQNTGLDPHGCFCLRKLLHPGTWLSHLPQSPGNPPPQTSSWETPLPPVEFWGGICAAVGGPSREMQVLQRKSVWALKCSS